MVLSKRDEYGDLVAIIRCQCGTHALEIKQLTFPGDIDLTPDYYITLLTDNFYWKQYNWWDRFKAKLVKIFSIICGKDYKIDEETVLSADDLEELIKVLQEMKEGEKKNEN